jgi:hypothetical protein
MIAKGRSISYLKASINYVLDREGAEILNKNIVAENADGVVQEFRLFQQANDRCHNNVLSFVISPDPRDGKMLSNERLEEINKKFLEKMGLDNHQYIAVVHNDKAHKHIHLYVNRIGYSGGAAWKDGKVSIRSGIVARSIAKEMGLRIVTPKQQAVQKERESPEYEIEKAKIKQLAEYVLKQGGVKSVPGFVSLFNEIGAESGFRAEMYRKNSGEFQGLRFWAGDHKFKGSEIDRSFSKQNIERHFEKINASKIVENVRVGSATLNVLGTIWSSGMNSNRKIGGDLEEEEKEEKDKKKGFGVSV